MDTKIEQHCPFKFNQTPSWRNRKHKLISYECVGKKCMAWRTTDVSEEGHVIKGMCKLIDGA